MSNPVKLNWVKTIRKYLDGAVIRLPLPNVDPNIISVLSVLFIIIALIFHDHIWWLFTWVLLSLIFDWLDGVIARKHKRATKKGYLIDVYCDRLSEGLLFIVFFNPWFYFFIVNLFLTVYSWKTKIHFVLALRLFFLIAIIMQAFGWIPGLTT